MSCLFLLITFVQHLDPLDVFFTEVVFCDYIPKFDVSILSHHGLEYPFLLGKSVLAVQHDGVVVKRSQQPILRGCQLEELVIQAFTERQKECISFSTNILFFKGQQVIFIYIFSIFDISPVCKADFSDYNIKRHMQRMHAQIWNFRPQYGNLHYKTWRDCLVFFTEKFN